jgi:hypothetical protein
LVDYKIRIPLPAAGRDARGWTRAPQHRRSAPPAPVQATDAFWHLMNFCAPALAVGGFAAALSRLVWRGELRRGFIVLWARASAAAVVASIAGLVVFERDGRMATYAVMVAASAAAIWWAGFRGAKH